MNRQMQNRHYHPRNGVDEDNDSYSWVYHMAERAQRAADRRKERRRRRRQRLTDYLD